MLLERAIQRENKFAQLLIHHSSFVLKEKLMFNANNNQRLCKSVKGTPPIFPASCPRKALFSGFFWVTQYAHNKKRRNVTPGCAGTRILSLSYLMMKNDERKLYDFHCLFIIAPVRSGERAYSHFVISGSRDASDSDGIAAPIFASSFYDRHFNWRFPWTLPPAFIIALWCEFPHV